MFTNSHLVEQARENVRFECTPFVPIEKAQFIWHRSEGRSAGMVVSPRATQTEVLQPLSCSTGADTAGWNSPTFNPITVFGGFLTERWINTDEYLSMISEFAKIDKCDWARSILQGMASSVGAFHDDDERSPRDDIQNIAIVERFRNTILDKLRLAGHELVPDLGDL